MEETWKSVVGYEGLYEVSNLGKVRNSIKQIIAQHLNDRGYARVNLHKDGNRKIYRVHRLVGDAFKGLKPEELETLHGGDVKLDNSADNLQYNTHAQNMADMVTNGHSTRGERNASAKLTWEQVREIRARLANGEKAYKLVGEYPISIRPMYEIANNRAWAE